MGPVVADTHVAVWYLSKWERLSARAMEALDETLDADETVYVATVSLVEIRYLIEKGRLPESTYQQLVVALHDPAVSMALVPLDAGVVRAITRVPRTEVADLVDRIIAATALYLNAPLVTRDRVLRASSVPTIW
jgi:PIN domain nuclease of toxin-antitoxin system